jgi:hypothetical protein
MKNVTCSPAALLGLPSPSDLEIRDDELSSVYESFIAQLELVADAKVILSNPYELEIDDSKLGELTQDWRSVLPRQEWKKLLFLSLLSRPMDASKLWPEGKRKFTDNEIVQLLFPEPNRLSLSDAKGEIPFGVGTLPGLLEALVDPGLSRLLGQIPLREPITTMTNEYVDATPGNYWYQMWQVAQWSENWAVVYGITDAGHGTYMFPWVLGFIHLDDAERNFVHLLHEGTERFDPGFYFSYGHIDTEWWLADIALGGEAEWVDWETVLKISSLEDSVLESLLDAEENPQDCRITARVTSVIDEAWERGLGDLSIEDLVKKVGKGSRLSDIEEYLENLVVDV